MNYLKLTRFAFEVINRDIMTQGSLYKERDNIYKKLQEEKKDYFPYIPIDSQRIGWIIEDIMSNNLSLEDKNFMDIGCGVPIIPKIFDILGCKKSKGLEYQKDYIDKYGDGFLIQGDLLTFNFEEYDYLYSYNPICDNKVMSEGLTNIMKTMKPGATFYFVQACGVKPEVMKNFIRLEKECCSSTYKFIKQ